MWAEAPNAKTVASITGLYEVLASKVAAKKVSAPDSSGSVVVSGLIPMASSVHKTTQLLFKIADASEKKDQRPKSPGAGPVPAGT